MLSSSYLVSYLVFYFVSFLPFFTSSFHQSSSSKNKGIILPSRCSLPSLIFLSSTSGCLSFLDIKAPEDLALASSLPQLDAVNSLFHLHYHCSHPGSFQVLAILQKFYIHVKFKISQNLSPRYIVRMYRHSESNTPQFRAQHDLKLRRYQTMRLDEVLNENALSIGNNVDKEFPANNGVILLENVSHFASQSGVDS